MSVKLSKITAFFVAVLTVFTSVAFALPFQYRIDAAEGDTVVADEAEFRAALEGNGGSYSLSSDITITVTEYEEYRYTVKKTVTIDLNGHKVTVKNTANLADNTNDSTLIKVENGGKLTFKDSSPNETGTLSYLGGIHLYSENEDYKDFKVVTGRHLIYLSEGATLTVDGGNYVAGNTEKEWLHRAAGVIDKKFEYYTGFAENTVCGTVITASTKSTLTINGGNFEANGRKRQNILPNLKGWNEERPASVCVRAEAKANVVVNDGNFLGAHGADVFALDATSKSSIKAGKFETTPSVNERVADYMDFAAVNVSKYYGKLNLPTVFIPGNSRKNLYQNGASIEKTADAVDGMPVYLIPNTADFASVSSSLTSGSYTPGSKGTLSSGYTPYFTSGSTITYSWYAIAIDGSVTPVSNSNKNTLDLSKLSGNGISLSVGSKYSFACVITESYRGYKLTTIARTLNLDTTNKNILAAVSLTPSSIDDNNNYNIGNAPTFKVPSNANYEINIVKWYEANSVTEMASPVTFKENTSYFVVFNLSAKGNYLFTTDTRISFLPGASHSSIAPSVDGKSATVSAWIFTACSHSSTEYVTNALSHDKTCTICGHVISSAKHTYTGWAEDGTIGVTVPMSRSCTVCSHKEKSAVFAPIDGEKTPIYEVKVDFGTPTDTSAPAKPTVASTPDSSKVIIDSYTWKTSTGADFTKFALNGKYVLTVVFKLADPDNNVFSDATVATSVHHSVASATLNEDKTELTVKYSVNTTVIGERQIYIPSIKIGEQISKANVNLYGSATVHWYKDGKKIGYCNYANETETDHDFDPDDGIDFLTHTFEADSVYYVRINWHITPGNQIDKNKVSITNAVPHTTSIVGGEFGFASACFITQTADKYIRSVKVQGIVEPVAGASAKTSGATVDASCTVKSIAFSTGGSNATKFSCGKEYTVTVTLAPKDGYTFALESATINGHGVTVEESGENIILTCTFSKLEHNIDNRNATVTYPTCLTDGSIVGKCKNCSVKSEIKLEKTGHIIYEIIGVASDCSKEGVKTHYFCNGCHKVFSDDKANTEITIESTVIPKATDKHVGNEVTVHNGNNHFTACVGCGKALTDEIAHEYGDAKTDAEGNEYYSCQCGHSVPLSGPKQPGFLIGGLEEDVVPPSNNGGFSLGSFSLDTIKTILIVMIIFIVLLIAAIITISIILIVTRDRSGHQALPDEMSSKNHISTVNRK